MKRDPSALKDLVSLFSWLRLLIRIRPDMVMLGTPKASLLGMVAATVARVPSRLYLLRGLRGETATGLTRRALFLLEKLTATCAHSVIAVSQSLATAFVAGGLAKEEKVIVLGRGSSNGVDLDRFGSTPGGAEPRSQAAVVGFVGRLTTDKGLAVLVEAEKLLLESEMEHRLLIVGGQDGLAMDQEAWPAGARVTETGHVDDAAPFYEQMTLLVLPTFREGFPNVVLEANAAGIPVVTTDATGAVDSVIDHVTGIITPVADAQALAAAVLLLLRDDDLRESYGRAGRRFVEEHYDRRHVWGLTESYMTSMLKAR
jgi:glycosyltransferase involved in cell wall biosynthesis